MSEAQTLNTATETHPARLGKIARLPHHIRQALNERLEDNEPSQRLVKWLNSLPETKEVLEWLFDGRAITEQNLSAWRQGGFRDWQRNQQTRVLAREFLDDADELEQELFFAGNCDGENHNSMLDRVANRMALSLLRLFREAELGEKGPQRTRTMLETAKQLAQLRQGDHQRRRAELAEQRREDELKGVAEKKAEEAQKELEQKVSALKFDAELFRRTYIRDLANGAEGSRRVKWTRNYFAEFADVFREAGIPDLPEGQELAALIEADRAAQRRAAEAAKAGSGFVATA
jgi:hypothetical protein